MSNIIIIAGGIFQGKSTLALRIASEYHFSGVVSTDMIRNTLKILYPNKEYFITSTHIWSQKNLHRESDDISSIIIPMIEMYEKRGEKIIFEGLHFSGHFFNWVKDKNYLKFVLNNTTSFIERILYKQITRKRLKATDGSFIENMSNMSLEDIQNSRYYYHQAFYQKRHLDLLSNGIKAGFVQVDFHTLDQAFEKIKRDI